jgi:molecular chaperone HscB
LALQRRTHPDGFTRATPAEKLRALEAASAVNEAYAVLKDPFRRAAHLLDGASPAPRDNADPELLDEVMEIQEFVAEAKESGDRARLESIRKDLRHRLAELDARLGSLFREGQTGREAEIRSAVVASKYWKGTLDEIRDQKR